MPRAEPTSYDATALVFLDAAAELIDAALSEGDVQRSARLRSMHFPPALDWIRVDDVIAAARSGPGGRGSSKKAFTNRWPTKDAFLRDAILHAILYRDEPGKNPLTPEAGHLFTSGHGSFSAEVLASADGLFGSLLDDPRSYLIAHIGPVLGQLPELQAEVQSQARASLEAWARGYAEVLDGAGLVLRPGWTMSRLALALQAILDGFVLRSRLNPREMAAARWESASLFADTVLAFVAAVLDPTRSGQSAGAWLDQRLSPESREVLS